MRVSALPGLATLLAGLMIAGSAFAGNPAVEGTDFKRLAKPLPVETGKQIEVAEFFWYRCPHCNELDPHLKSWAKTLPADVKLRPVPAVFRDNWLPGSKLYYTLVEMGAYDKLHSEVFNAYHLDNLNLDDKTQLMAWVKKQGLDAAKFESIYNSFSTQTKAMKGAQAARAAGIDGVPALLVDGKYLTSMSMTYTEARLFDVLNQLIDRARKERGGKPAKPAAETKPAAKPVAAH